VGASVWNLLNNENVINRYYIVAPGNELKRVDEFSLGITPNVIVRVTF
jgi:hypothetical protein